MYFFFRKILVVGLKGVSYWKLIGSGLNDVSEGIN